MYDEVVIGIDQSYQNTGVSIVVDGRLKDIKSVRLDKYKNNSQKRGVLHTKLQHLMSDVTNKSNSVVCIVERARLHGGPTSFVNIDAIKAMGALTATIVDVMDQYGVKVYSVDTRCWKSQVIGTSKPQSNNYGVPEEKWPTIRWCIRQGFEQKLLVDVSATKKQKGTFVRAGKKYQYNNDAADSAGIAMYWVLGDHNKLQLEK